MNLETLMAGFLEKSASTAETAPEAGQKVNDPNTITSDVKPDGQEKSAAFKSGQDLAKEIMEKVASTKIEQSKDTDMNKQASDAGKALAQALLTKMAGAGDVNTDNGFADGVVPNKTQQDLATQRAEHDASFQPTPGTDGQGNGGTISQIFDAIVADAAARTGAVVSGQTATSPAEGAINRQAPNQEQVDDSQEKMAAAISLVNSGMDFDEAVELVKAASDELEAEHEQQVKQAAFNELLESGVDFDLAVAMVKQAGAMTAAKGAGSAVAKVSKGMSAGKKVAIGAAAAGAAGGAAYGISKGREKKAALDALIDAGIDYDDAAEYVAQM